MRPWIAVAVLLLPVSAWAQTVTYCVGDAAYFAASSSPCDFAAACDFTSTLGIADVLGDTVNTTNPSDLDVDICVWDMGVHVESLELNGDTMNLGQRVNLHFRTDTPSLGTWCPDPLSGQLDGFNLRNLYDESDPDVGFFIDNMFVPDDPACDEFAGVAESVFARAEFQHGAAYIGSAQSGGRAQAFNTGGGALALRTMYLYGGDRAVVHGDGDLEIYDSAVVGIAGSSGKPLVDSTNGASLEIGSSALIGNGSVQQPLIRATADALLRDVKILGNAVTGGESLLSFYASSSPDRNWLSNIVDCEIARNSTWVESAPTTLIGGVPSPTDAVSGLLACLPAIVSGLDPTALTASAAATAGGGPVIKYYSDQGTYSNGLSIVGSMLVQNEVNPADGIVVVEGLLGSTGILLLNDTVEVPPGVPLLTSSAGSGTLTSARNLYLGDPTLALAAPWTTIESTMDLIDGDAAGWAASFNSVYELSGPLLETSLWAPGLGFESAAGYDALSSDCERAMVVCPDLTLLECMGSDTISSVAWCPADAGRDYLPDASTRGAWGVEWPWVEFAPAFLPLPLVERRSAEPDYNMPGATGLRCASSALPADELVEAPSGQSFGDGDGFTSLVDCDNEASATVPSVADPDGYSAPDCVGDTCYSCPTEVPVWLQADDDDSAGADDDDSAQDDDDSAWVNDDDSAWVNDDDSAGADDDDSAGADDDDSAGADDDDSAQDDDDSTGADDDDSAQDDDDSAQDDDDSAQDDDDSAGVDDDDSTGVDEDGDGSPVGVDCDDGNPAMHPGNPEVCDGLDNDCDGAAIDEEDADADGFRVCEGDCYDDPADDVNDATHGERAAAKAHPGALELCNGIDDNCDLEVQDYDGVLPDGTPICPAGSQFREEVAGGCRALGCGTSYGLAGVVPLLGLARRRRRTGCARLS